MWAGRPKAEQHLKETLNRKKMGWSAQDQRRGIGWLEYTVTAGLSVDPQFLEQIQISRGCFSKCEKVCQYGVTPSAGQVLARTHAQLKRLLWPRPAPGRQTRHHHALAVRRALKSRTRTGRSV